VWKANKKGGNKMRKFLAVIVLIGIISLGLGSCPSYASEVDALLQKLIDKGVLNASEAQEIRSETNEQIAKTDKQKEEDYKKLAKDNMPDWVKNTKIKGDFRLREEWRRNKNLNDLQRTRIRARLGIESKINEKLNVGVGIATGAAGDPRSRNMTLGGKDANTPGDPGSIVLDYAYAEYHPFTWLTLSGGKFQNPLWRPHDMLWKGDITPEGLGFNLNYEVNPKLQLFMNDLVFILNGKDSQTAPGAGSASKFAMLYAFQPGFNYNFTNTINLKSALTYNYFNQVKGGPQFVKNSKTNTIVNGVYAFDYNSINPSAELGFKKPFADIMILKNIPYLAFFGDFIYNVSPGVTTSKSGYDAGIKFGVEKVANWKDWQAKLTYSRLGRDAWLDNFTDSDRAQGRTNTKGIEAQLDYGLGKNTWLSIDYYYMQFLTKDYQGVTGSAQIPGYAPEQLLQLDWNMKF